MLWALLLAASMADWVPARWNSADPATVAIARQANVNCLLIEKAHWSAEFSGGAAKAGLVTLGVLRAGDSTEGLAERLKAAGLAGAVFEGDHEAAVVRRVRAALADSGLATVELGLRSSIPLDGEYPILGTNQGVWPGINAVDDGSAKAAPSGGPWIDTNNGFVRFLRSVTKASLWLGNRPPEGKIFPAARYAQAVADAAFVGARWVIALDADLEKRLLAGDAAALKAWRDIGEHVRFYENKEWRALPPAGQLAIVQDVASGGLVSGGILDMISTKHTPVRPVPGRFVDDAHLAGAKMAVNVDPEALDAERKEALRRFARGGGTLLTAAPGWKFPPQKPGQITLDEKEIEKLDAIWKDVNSMTGRHNLGARLFHVDATLSNLTGAAGAKQLVLHLVNYADFAKEDVTIYLPGKHTKAVLHEPGGKTAALEVYAHEEGTGIDIKKIATVGAVVVD